MQNIIKSTSQYLLGALGLAAFVLTVTPAQSEAAGGNFKLGLSGVYSSYSTETPGGGTSEHTLTLYNLKAGTFFSNIYVGAIYDSRTDDSGGGSKAERSGWGATIGYHSNGWFIDGSYFISSAIKMGSTEIKEGSGFGIDLGKNFSVSSSVFVGAQLSYRSFEYKKFNNLDATYKIKTDMIPMVNLGVMF